MEDMFVKVATQVPSLAVLVFIVWFFIKYLNRRDDSMQIMNKEHLDAREQSRSAIRDNTIAMNGNTQAIQELRLAVERSRPACN